MEEAGFGQILVDTTDDVLDAPMTASPTELQGDPGPDGKISLREALLAAANASQVQIEFLVSGTIAPLTELPPIPSTAFQIYIRGAGGIVLDGSNLLGMGKRAGDPGR